MNYMQKMAARELERIAKTYYARLYRIGPDSRTMAPELDEVNDFYITIDDVISEHEAYMKLKSEFEGIAKEEGLDDMSDAIDLIDICTGRITYKDAYGNLHDFVEDTIFQAAAVDFSTYLDRRLITRKDGQDVA